MGFPYPVKWFFCTEYARERLDSSESESLAAKMKMNEVFIGPVQGETGIEGLRLDFNFGLRLEIPAGNWHVRVSDADSGCTIFEDDLSATVLQSVEAYYVRWQIDVARDGIFVFSHTFDASGQNVFFIFRSTMLGDALALFPYVREWQRVRGSRVSYFAPDNLQGLLQRLYPDIPLYRRVPDNTYATYFLTAGINGPADLPTDGRLMPLWQAGRLLLDLPRPIMFSDVSSWPPPRREIMEPYVCISVQASVVRKGWLYPGGWERVTEYLKQLGYRVLCIDKERMAESEDGISKMPEQAEDFTGNHPLTARADLLYHADFFIGLGSGLAWLARTVGCPVIMISGFSYPWTEFPTPYRIFNRLVCNGCYNDIHSKFLSKGCRYPRKSKRWMECSRTISPAMVIEAIDRLRDDNRKDDACNG